MVTANRVDGSSTVASTLARRSVVGPALHGDASLADRRDEDGGVEALGDACGQAEHLEGRHGDDDRPTVGHLLEAPGDVAAQLDESKIRANCGELSVAAHRAGRHDGAGVESGERQSDEGVGSIAPGAKCGEAQLVRRLAREVFGGVHGGIGATVEHGLLDLLDEYALAADRVQRHLLLAVSRRLHEDQLRRPPSDRRDRRGDDLSLGSGLRAGAGRQAERCRHRHSSAWAEVEEFADGGGVAFTLRRAGVVTQPHRGLVQQFGDDRLGQRLDGFVVLRTEFSETR